MREDSTTTGRDNMKPARILRAIFGIFMIVVYVGMGVLLMINFFQWDSNWAWARWIVGVVLVIYGFFRGWRQYKGLDSPY